MTLGDSFSRVLDAARTGAEWAVTSLYQDLSKPVLRYLTSQEPAEATKPPVELVSIDEIVLSDVQVVSGGRTVRGDIEIVPEGKGLRIHRLTAGREMPLAHRLTPANGDARAQVVPLRAAVKVHTGNRGRPRTRLKVIATDKGYAAKARRQQLRKRGIRAQIPKRVWKTKKNRGRPSKKVVPRFQAERTFAWFQQK